MTTTQSADMTHRPPPHESPSAPATAQAMRRLASWKLWLVATIAFLAFAGVFFGSSAPFAIPTVEAACGEPPLDVRFTSTAADVDTFLTACGPAGRDAYRDMQLADLLYPAVFGVFMASSLALALGRLVPQRPAATSLAALPLLGAAFDYIENVFAWSALLAYPSSARTNSLLGIASAAKTATFWLSGSILLLTLGALIITHSIPVVSTLAQRSQHAEGKMGR